METFTLASNGPSIVILGSSTGTILESLGATISFQVQISDPSIYAPNMQIEASSPDGLVSHSEPIENPTEPTIGTATITFELTKDFVTGDIPITVTTSDGLDISAPASFTLDITAVDPPPAFLTAPSSVRFSENVLASAKGSSSPLGVQYIDLTSTGATDTAAVTISATSSNPALIAPSDIVITKSGLTGYDTMEIFSKAGAYGSATITLTANDGTKSTSIIIPVSVNEVAVQPVITLPAAETYKESAGWQTISIPVSIPPVNGVIPYVELSETRAAFRLGHAKPHCGGRRPRHAQLGHRPL